ncbi:efflux RND transporter periplasmic adaptor subunit [Chitinimonas sp.]|uniref:efflux RND transporter periplasmic adaptor subunit n=1 Tax=Chitinimonas sp. TaxID=1934313 RepID=UPI0035B10FA2
MRFAQFSPLILAVALAACSKAPEQHEEIRSVRVQTVKAVDGALAANYSGEVRARRESPQGFRIAGQILERYVELGQQVKAGQPLLKIDPKDVALQEAAARSQFDKARMDLERAKTLQAKGFVSQSNVDQAKVAFDAMQAQYKLAGNQGSYTVLRAEHAGVVTALNAEVGQVVAAGAPVVKIAEDGEREVLVSVPESRIEELRHAKQLTVSLWAAPDKQYQGRLRELAPDTDPITRTYAARVTIVAPDQQVRLGMTAYVTLPGEQGQAYSLPMSAIYDNSGKPQVWVVDGKTMQVALRPVSLAGARNGTVLIDKGLQAGEQVVTAGANLLHAGEKVRIADALPGGEK